LYSSSGFLKLAVHRVEGQKKGQTLAYRFFFYGAAIVKKKMLVMLDTCSFQLFADKLYAYST